MTDYAFNIVVKDTAGVAVNSATIKIYDSTDTDLYPSTTLTTNASGVLASNLTISDSNNPKRIVVSKTGYNATTQKLNIDNEDLNYYISLEAFTTSYTTVDEVRSFMRLRKQFQGVDTTRTTDSDVAKRINKAEDFIDNYCNDSWRETQVTEYYDVLGAGIDQNGLEEIPLRHSNLYSLSSTDGDIFSVWNGSGYEDYLTKTEGRANDYWLDYEAGILFVNTANVGKRVLKLKYRYGNKAVPSDIRDACILLVVQDLITTDQFASTVPEGYNTLDFYNQATIYKRNAEEMLELRKKIFTS